jgi:hypothetical protein
VIFGDYSGTIIKDPGNPRQAFERQSKPLKDAFFD